MGKSLASHKRDIRRAHRVRLPEEREAGFRGEDLSRA